MDFFCIKAVAGLEIALRIEICITYHKSSRVVSFLVYTGHWTGRLYIKIFKRDLAYFLFIIVNLVFTFPNGIHYNTNLARNTLQVLLNVFFLYERAKSRDREL